MVCGGNVLLEGVPGLGKTQLVKTLGRALELDYNRIQFTPDLMPADVVGTLIYSPSESKFSTKKGPIFTNLLLADEINRATPKTQSAMLEAMQECSVTVGGETRPLGPPFLVMATQNPIEQEGTYPLPEAQLDRFLMEINVGYPEESAEREIMLATTSGSRTRAEAIFATDDETDGGGAPCRSFHSCHVRLL